MFNLVHSVEGFSNVTPLNLKDACVTYTVLQPVAKLMTHVCYCGNSRSEGISRPLCYGNWDNRFENGSRVRTSGGTLAGDLLFITSTHGNDVSSCNWKRIYRWSQCPSILDWKVVILNQTLYNVVDNSYKVN
jgi:hypothetical protein